MVLHLKQIRSSRRWSCLCSTWSTLLWRTLALHTHRYLRRTSSQHFAVYLKRYYFESTKKKNKQIVSNEFFKFPHHTVAQAYERTRFPSLSFLFNFCRNSAENKWECETCFDLNFSDFQSSKSRFVCFLCTVNCV